MSDEFGGESGLFRLIVDGLSDFAVFFISPDGTVRTWNLGASLIFGYSADEIIGQKVSILFIPEDRRRGEHFDELARAARYGYSSDNRWHQRQDGSQVWVRGSVTGLYRSGELLGFAKVVADWTEGKRVEEELRSTQSELSRYARKLEDRVAERTGELEKALGELEAFCYSISHNLRAPLRAMEGFAYMLRNQYGPCLGDEGRDYASRIREAAKRMDKLIQDLLAYAYLSREEVALAPVSLEAAAEAALRSRRAAIDARGAEVEIAKPLGNVLAQSSLLQKVVSNLLSNSLKFVSAEETPKIRIYTTCPEPGRIRLWIEDNGLGIDPEYHARIFQPFERLHPPDRYGGTGIGLAFARKAMERLNGSMGLESRLGQGSRFWLELVDATGGAGNL